MRNKISKLILVSIFSVLFSILNYSLKLDSSYSQAYNSVEIPFKAFLQKCAPEVQEKDKWCWAACISMLFHYYGHPVSQVDIVTAAYGMPVNMPAGAGITIAKQLNRVWLDMNGKKFSSRLTAAYDYTASIYDLNNPRLVDELKHQHPIIIGVGYHAVVLLGVEYVQFPTGFINVTSAKVFDPWPGIGFRNLTTQEMIPAYPWGYHFAATIRIE